MTNRHGLNIYREFRYLRTTLPMVTVSATGGYVEFPTKSNGSHAFNAVYLGDPTKDDYLLDNWYFFEPQNDADITDPFHHIGDWNLIDFEIPLGTQQYAPTRRLAGLGIDSDGSVISIPEVQREIIGGIENDVLTSYGDTGRQIMIPQNLGAYTRDELRSAVGYAIRSHLFRSDQIEAWLKFSELPEHITVNDVLAP